MAAFRLRKPGGGSTLRGGDGLRGADGVVVEYVAAGGGIASGTGVVAFIRAPVPEEIGHGAGHLVTRTPGIPIRRRQYGEPVVFGYVASGGAVAAGTAAGAFARNSIVHEGPEPAGGALAAGDATVEFEAPEEELLLLLAA